MSQNVLKGEEKSVSMNYLDQRRHEEGRHAEITQRLKACAGEIISHTLTIEHVPQSAREIMANPIVHQFVRAAFRDVVVDCLAAYFDRLEESREELLEDVVRRTKSKYGTRLRVVQSAIERTYRGEEYRDVLTGITGRITPEVYNALVVVVRIEYARQY